MKVTTLGIDIARNVFQLHGVDDRSQPVLRRKVSRNKLLTSLANLGPCLIGMEACGGSHYWAREFQRWKANLRILEIEEIKTVPYVPMPHSFVERLIGTTRREYLDHVPFWNARDLERKLSCFQDYYNCERAHQGIGGTIPEPAVSDVTRYIASLDDYRWKSCCRSLYQLPIAA